MIINVDLFYSLKKYCSNKLKGDESSFAFEIKDRDEINLTELINLLNIPYDEVGFATKNKVKFDWNNLIYDGDTLKIYPVIIAG